MSSCHHPGSSARGGPSSAEEYRSISPRVKYILSCGRGRIMAEGVVHHSVYHLLGEVCHVFFSISSLPSDAQDANTTLEAASSRDLRGFFVMRGLRGSTRSRKSERTLDDESQDGGAIDYRRLFSSLISIPEVGVRSGTTADLSWISWEKETSG